MKKRLLAVLLAVCLVVGGLPLVVSAEETVSGTCGENLTWFFEDGVLTISGTGDMYDYNSHTTPWNDLLQNIIRVMINPGVTSIGTNSFYGARSLRDISMPDSIVKIGKSAFSVCASLPSVNIPKNAKIEFGSTIEIGGVPFWYCPYLSDIYVEPDNPYYTSIDGVLYDKGVTTLLRCPEGKTGELVVPDGVTVIAENAFDQTRGGNLEHFQYKLTSIYLPSSVVSIPTAGFTYRLKAGKIMVDQDNPKFCVVDDLLLSKDCTELIKCCEAKTGNVVIPNSVTKIYKAAFDWCTEIESVFFPQNAIYYRNDGQPATAVSEGGFPFEGLLSECFNLKEISVAAGHPQFCSLHGALFSADQSILVHVPKKKTDYIVLPQSITKVNSSDFSGALLSDIYFHGTEDEFWDLLFDIPDSILEDFPDYLDLQKQGFLNSCPATLHFNSSGPSSPSVTPTPIPTASPTPSVSPRPSHNPSTTISVTVRKTDIEATNVSNHNGYAGLFKWDGYGNQVSNYESAFIDKTGRFLFPYQNTFAMYSYYGGIISCIEGNSGYGENMLFGDSGNLRGYYDLSGNKLISHNYKFISPMKNGYAFVRELPQGSYLPNRDSLTGINRTAYLSSYLIDENGNNVLTLPDVFNIAYFDGIPISGGATYTFSGGLTEFSEGLIGFWSLLPLEGNIFQDTRYTSDQIANLISTQEGYKGAYIGYMDLNGNIVIPPKYVKNYLLTLPDTVAPFKEGLARMANSEGDKVGFIDKTGTVVIPFEYDYSTSSGSFSDGLAPVKKNGKAGYINKQNQTIIPFEYDYALEAGGGVCPIGFYPSNTSSGVSYPKYGLVDYENNLVLPIEYDAISTCENGVVYAIKDHTLYIVTIKGTSTNTPSPSPTATPTPTSTPTPIPTSSPSPTAPVTTTDTSADGTVTTTTTWPDGKTSVDVKSPNGDKKLTVANGQSEKLAEISIPSNPGPGKDFKDVSNSAWYKDDVAAATSFGLFAGTGPNQFSPDLPMTRGMLATVLYNLSGNVEYGLGTGKFSDVSGKAWYKDSVDWAQATGVVAGIGGGKYGPDNNITREQLVTMLYNYAELIGKDSEKAADISRYSDGGKVSSYAEKAMSWAVAERFVSGVGNNRLNPKGNATRAQVAAVLTRFVNYLKK